VGCGKGSIAQTVTCKGYAYVGIDINKSRLLEAFKVRSKGDVFFLQGDINSIPFRPCFKLVLATEIIEHFENFYRPLLEINNILIDNGYLLISTPNKASLEGVKGKIFEIVLKKRWTAWNNEHKHIFSSFEILSLLKSNFKIVRALGYYFLPRIPMSVRFEGRFWFGGRLRFSRTHHKPLNMLGFQIIALLKKISGKKD